MLPTLSFRVFPIYKVVFLASCLVITACGSSKKTTESVSEKKARKLKKVSEKAVKDEEPHTPEWYIHKYKRFAIKEMKESGVPASITLAQGMLESSYGKSKLASQGKNHFGIKCHKDNWDGGEMYLADDRPNECFRTYETVFQSYRDHSKFLEDGYRYNELFELKTSDYRKWAKGLKDAGYATNPRYDDILIRLIEKHDLHYFDQFHDKPFKPEDGVQLAGNEQESGKKDDEPKNGGAFEKNGLNAVKVSQNENLSTISNQVSLSRSDLIRYNDLSKRDQLREGDILYLEAKKDKPAKSYHVVEPDETLWDIAQEYSVKYEKLLDRNRLNNNEQPAPGSRVFLRERRYTKVEVRKKPVVKNQDESRKAGQNVNEGNTTNKAEVQSSKKPSSKTPRFHKVSDGETMQQIAQKYDMPVALLYKKNRMENGEQPAVGAKIHLKERRYIKPELSNGQNRKMAKKPSKAGNRNNYKDNRDAPKSRKSGQEETNNEDVGDEPNMGRYGDDQTKENKRSGSKIQKTRKKPSGKEEKANSSIESSENGGNNNANLPHHKVKPEETLYGIAKQYGTGVKNLKAWNNLESNNIETGQKLRVQKPGIEDSEEKENASSRKASDEENDNPSYHTVADGETLYQISVEYNIPVSELKAFNDMETNEVEIGQKLRLQPKSDDDAEKKSDEGNKRSFHRVEQGETLYSIANQYEVTIQELKSINDLEDNNVDIGQKLYLEKDQ